MASKRKISETGPSAVHLSILKYLKSEGLKETVSTFTKEAKLEKANFADALDLAKLFPETKTEASKKAKVESDSDSSSSSSSDSSSDSDSDEEEAKPAAKSAPVATKKMETSDSSSSSDSDSSSDSEDEKPAAKAAPVKAAPAKAAPVKKDDSSSSSSSDSSSSDSSDSEDEAPPAKIQKTETPAKTPAKPAAVAAVTPGGSGSFKAYVRGLPWAATAEELNDFFKACGSADSEMIIGDDGRASGTALVKFGARSELDAALALDGQYWPNTERWLKIVESTEKNEGSRKTFAVGERPEGCDTIFLGNLSWDVDEESIRSLFGTVGEISNVRFATGEDGSFRGFGHVSFYNGEDTTKAIALAGTDVCGRPIRVDYAPPRNREAKSPGGRGGRGDAGGRGGRGRGDAGGRGGRGGGFTPKKAITPSGKKMTFDE